MTLASAPSPSRSLQAQGLLWPALAVAAAGPFTLAALGAPGDDSLILVTPTVAGLVAAPGYLYGLLRWPWVPGLSAGLRWWVRLSFATVILASLAGAVLSLALVLPSICSALTVVTAVATWRRLERGEAVARPAR